MSSFSIILVLFMNSTSKTFDATIISIHFSLDL
jgi:hypothetical protein